MFVRSNFGTVAAYGGIVFVLTLAVGVFMSVTFFIINEATRYNPFLNLAAKIFQNILAFTVGIIISPYFEIVKTYMVIEIGNKEEENEGTAGEGGR
jgi:glycerol-3-phosphate acyltransferase PlsY